MGLKEKTASTLKWNTIDRFATQLLYGVSGIVLANLLTKAEFGLVGILSVFQAFALLFVDSGFGAALVQKKEIDEADYSTVFWFNLTVSILIYGILYAFSPLIASFFNAPALLPMSRVMFVTFVFSGLGMVQSNRLVKQMDVKQIAIADLVSLTLSTSLGISLACADYGAWAIVWQSVSYAALRSGWLWLKGGWTPIWVFSISSLRKIVRLGMSVFTSSFFNTLFLNVYQFVIGKWYSLSQLGVYSQADKWSKIGSTAISQILTASFVPLLSKVQDDMETFHRYMRRIDRFTALIACSALVLLAAAASGIFHLLFGTKWDDAIPLFQILCIRGIGVVFVSLYSNFMMALGYGRQLIVIEIVKDVATGVALLATVFSMNLETLVWGQLAATGVTWITVAILTSRHTGYTLRKLMADVAPFALTAALAALAMWLAPIPVGDISHALNLTSLATVGIQMTVGLMTVFLVLWLCRVPELKEISSHFKES